MADVAHTFKILLLGSPAVGKTALVQRFVHSKFRKDYVLTIGLEPYIKYVDIKKKHICLTLFDIAGSARFSKLRKMFYRGSRGALIVFDLTRRDTFEKVREWTNDALQEAPKQSLVLVGNKDDLIDERVISRKEGESLAKELGFIKYIETSALTGVHVNEAFHSIASYLLDIESKKKKSKTR